MATVGVAATVGLLASACNTSESGGESAGGGPPGTIETGTYNLQGEGETPQFGGSLSYGITAEPDGFNPAQGRWAGSAYTVGFSVYDPLAAYDAEEEPQPYLAKTIEANDDFTEWTIGLREGVTFHNGEPVDADAVALNLTTQKDSPLTGEAFSFMDDAVAVDPLTVKVTMNKPWSTFPHILTAQTGAVASPETLTSADGNSNPVGSGPFSFVVWDRGSSVKFKKNAQYWRTDTSGKALPYLDDLEFRIIPDIQTRGAALQSGQVNMFETNDPDQILSYIDAAERGEVQLFTDQSADGQEIFVGLNTTKEPFDDPIARQAVAYAGDVEALSELAYSGVFPPAYGPFSENSFFYVPREGYPEHDLAKATELAQEYQAKHGKPLEFTANIIPVPEVERVAQVLQQQLADAGITVNLNSIDQAKLIVDALSGNYQATGFILFGSPHLDREYVFIASDPKPNGEFSLNFTRNGLNPDGTPNDANDAIVEAMNKARTTDDREQQKEQYAIVQEEMVKNLNFLFLVRQTTALVMDDNVRGAYDYTLPDESNAPGPQGLPQINTFTFNLWVAT